MRKKEEEYDKIFKRSKLVERSSSNREEKENGREDGLNELITILKELKKDLKEEMADLKKKVKKMKEEDESGKFEEENGYDGKKIKEIKKATIDKSKKRRCREDSTDNRLGYRTDR